MADSEDNVDRELFRNIEKLRELRIAHRDLDEIISRLSLDIHIDELQLKRLKKRKLMLKDQITILRASSFRILTPKGPRNPRWTAPAADPVFLRTAGVGPGAHGNHLDRRGRRPRGDRRRYARLWLQRSGHIDSSNWLGASVEGAVIAAPMFIGIVALFLLHLLLSRHGARADLLNVACS